MKDLVDGSMGRGSDDQLDVEALVIEIVGELLDTDDVGPDDHFFTIGGTSVEAMHLVARLGRTMRRSIRTSVLFDHPVLSDFARVVAEPGDR